MELDWPYGVAFELHWQGIKGAAKQLVCCAMATRSSNDFLCRGRPGRHATARLPARIKPATWAICYWDGPDVEGRCALRNARRTV